MPEIDHSKERKYFLLGALFFIISFLALFILEVKTVAEKLPNVQGLLLPIILIVWSLTAITGTYILHKVARKFSAAQSTWRKAFFAVGIWGIFGSVFLGMEQFMHLSGLFALVLIILFFAVQTAVFVEIYAFRPAKAFLAVIINFISLLIIMAVFGVILSVAVAGVNNAHQTNNAPIEG